jgi:hypothetical protein
MPAGDVGSIPAWRIDLLFDISSFLVSSRGRAVNIFAYAVLSGVNPAWRFILVA